MLDNFVIQNRAEIITRCRSLFEGQPRISVSEEELEHGVPLFLDQLTTQLQTSLAGTKNIIESATKHAGELKHRGFTIAQVVRDYGAICQSITELAVERAAPITSKEFQTLNLCLDEAIAGAVTEFTRLNAHDGTERLGHLAHELRNVLNTSILAFGMLKSGRVAIGGSTGGLLGRSLNNLRDIIERELADVRLGAGISHRERVVLRDFLGDIEIGALMAAEERSIMFSMSSVPRDVVLRADRQILSSVVWNLLQNAFKFTGPGGHVSLRAQASGNRVLINIEDECGGLPAGDVERLFKPFKQEGVNRDGVGLGLSIARRGAEANGGVLRVTDKPGHGCVFTVELPLIST